MKNKNSTKIQDFLLGSALLSWNMAAVVLCAAVLLITERLLSGWVEMVCMLAGGILALGLLTIYFCLESRGQERAVQKIRGHWGHVLRAELWMLTAAGLCGMGYRLTERFLPTAVWKIVIMVLLVSAAVMAVSLILHHMLKKCGWECAESSVRQVLCIFGILLSGLGLLAAGALGWRLCFGGIEPSVAGMFAYRIFVAFCEYGLVKLVMAAARGRKTAEEGTSEGEGEEAGKAEHTTESAEDAVKNAEYTGESEARPEALGAVGTGIMGDTTPKEAPGAVEIGSLGDMASKEKPRAAGTESMANATPKEAPEAVGTGNMGDTKSKENQPAAGWRGAVVTVIPLVLTIILAVFHMDSPFAPSVGERVKTAVEGPIQEAYAAMEEGNMEAAIQALALAEARAGIFRSLVSEDTERTPADFYREYPEDVIIGTLYLSGTGYLEDAEAKIRNNTLGSQWYPVLLMHYEDLVSGGGIWREKVEELNPEEKALTEEQEILRRELLTWCVGTEQFGRGDTVFARELEGKKFAVLKQLKEYEEEFETGRILELVARYGAEGGYTEEMVYQALTLAEEAPENLLLQYAACKMGSSHQKDGADHYERTVEAADRFDRLYDDGTRTEEQIIEEKRFLGDVALKCYSYDAALRYYEDSCRLSGDSDVMLLCADILEKQEKYAECAEMAEEVLEEDPENTRALYLAAVASLKAGNVEDALEAAGRMGDLLANRSNRADPAAENCLYICAQYFAMQDSSGWTDYQWLVYPSLSEEQIQAVQSHGLLWDYMTAVYQCFMKKDYEAAEAAVENILEIREDLPMAWYLRGTIAFSGKEFERALEFFRKAEDCGGVAPALYFSMANTYDALEDYENAWLYSRRVEEMLPYQDHGNDVYGISIHNKNLLSMLGKKLGR